MRGEASAIGSDPGPSKSRRAEASRVHSKGVAIGVGGAWSSEDAAPSAIAVTTLWIHFGTRRWAELLVTGVGWSTRSPLGCVRLCGFRRLDRLLVVTGSNT